MCGEQRRSDESGSFLENHLAQTVASSVVAGFVSPHSQVRVTRTDAEMDPGDVRAYGPRLITNGPDRTMESALRADLEREDCTDFIWSVAFVSDEEIRALKQSFLDFHYRLAARGIPRAGTILTSTYEWFNSPEAFAELVKLAHDAGIETRVWGWHRERDGHFRLSDQRGFHAKGYAFTFGQRGIRTIYIGSSNLTHHALSDNKEWNLRVSSLSDGQIVSQLRSELEVQLADSVPLTSDWIETYRPLQRRYRPLRAMQAVEGGPQNPDSPEEEFLSDTFPTKQGSATPSKDESEPIRPNRMQAEALSNLARTRRDGQTRGIIISATGTGKTYLSALDIRQLRESLKLTGRGRFHVLYLVDQRQILVQAMRSYQRVLQAPAAAFALLSGQGEGVPDGMRHYSGTQVDELVSAMEDLDNSVEYVFATVQTLADSAVLNSLDSEAFDYVLADEAHHSVTPTYRRILEHFHPRFLLGMTATPERTGEGNDSVFALFGNNVVYEIRLRQALDEKMLCPFHYYGVSDFTVDGRQFTAGDDGSAQARVRLAENLTGGGQLGDREMHEKARYMIHKLRLYSQAEIPVRGIVFCSRQEEAVALSRAFNEEWNEQAGRLYRTAPVTSGAQKESVDRTEAVRRLEESRQEKDCLDYVFAVDLFNEGVDIPDLNQVVMVRPTQSAIVFTQQLGRGLRQSPGKRSVMVIDFIGNYQSNYLIAVALAGGDGGSDKDMLRKSLRCSDIGESSVSFDEISRSLVLRSIESADLTEMKRLTDAYRNARTMLNRVPTLLDLSVSDRSLPFTIASKKRDYLSFIVAQEKRQISISQAHSDQRASVDQSEGATIEGSSFVDDEPALLRDCPQAHPILVLLTELMRGLRPQELVALAALYSVKLDVEGMPEISEETQRMISKCKSLNSLELNRLTDAVYHSADPQGITRHFAADAADLSLHVLGVTSYFTAANQSRFGGTPLVAPAGAADKPDASQKSEFSASVRYYAASPLVKGWLKAYPSFRKVFEDTIRTGIHLSVGNFAEAVRQGLRIDRGFVYGWKYTLREIMRLCGWRKEDIPQNVGGYKLMADLPVPTLPIMVKYANSQYEDRFLDQGHLRYMSKAGRTMQSREFEWIRTWNGETGETNSRGEEQAHDHFVPLFIMRKPKEGARRSKDLSDKAFYYVGPVRRFEAMHDTFSTEHVSKDGKPQKIVRMTLVLDEPVEQTLFDHLTGEGK